MLFPKIFLVNFFRCRAYLYSRPIPSLRQPVPNYMVLIKYCVFFKILKYSGPWHLSVFPLGVSVCTHTRQVEHQRCSRTGRVQKTHHILRKNRYLMNSEHPVSLSITEH